MKLYLAITGILFALLAALHAWRVIADWDGFNSSFYGTALPGLMSAGLSIWAWVLLARSKRSEARPIARS
jgi:hypothetical protein